MKVSAGGLWGKCFSSISRPTRALVTEGELANDEHVAGVCAGDFVLVEVTGVRRRWSSGMDPGPLWDPCWSRRTRSVPFTMAGVHVDEDGPEGGEAIGTKDVGRWCQC
jgi:hypothetical protein